MQRYTSRGFTLIEILLSLAVIALIATIVIPPFNDFRARKGLDAATETIFAAFAQARMDTLSTKGNRQWGVHLASSTVTVYQGPTYVAGTTSSTVYPLSVAVEIVNVALNGSTTVIYFDRLLGTTQQYGTFDVRVKNNTAIRVPITVSQTGTASL